MRSVIGRYGEVWYYGKDRFIGRGLHAYGEFSHQECMNILALAREGDGVCLDIGANMGCISQMLEYHGMTVVAFEPQPELIKVLEKNFKGSIKNFALGSEEKTEVMPKYDYSSNGSFGEASLGTKSALGSITVDVKKLDNFFFGKIGFMKIDVEGYELEVLKGARETILKYKPLMYIEDDRAEKSPALHAYLSELGYICELDVTKLYNPDNFFNNSKRIWDRDYVSLNLICRPKKC
jgi:FkbM family methyltransferase